MKVLSRLYRPAFMWLTASLKIQEFSMLLYPNSQKQRGFQKESSRTQERGQAQSFPDKREERDNERERHIDERVPFG